MDDAVVGGGARQWRAWPWEEGAAAKADGEEDWGRGFDLGKLVGAAAIFRLVRNFGLLRALGPIIFGLPPQTLPADSGLGFSCAGRWNDLNHCRQLACLLVYTSPGSLSVFKYFCRQ